MSIERALGIVILVVVVIILLRVIT
jgi:hypothetical protein